VSTYFGSVEEAKSYAMGMFSIPGLRLEEIEPQPIGTIFSDELLEAAGKPDASEGDKQIAEGIRTTMAAQRTFRFVNSDGTEHEFALKKPINGKTVTKIRVTIGPFRDGFDCWISTDISPFARRL